MRGTENGGGGNGMLSHLSKMEKYKRALREIFSIYLFKIKNEEGKCKRLFVNLYPTLMPKIFKYKAHKMVVVTGRVIE